jgi:predicted ribosome quality control (RQC) complex YloA/Tae2 family protein
MSLNWKEIDTILEELDLPGSFIQKIRQPNYHSLLIDLYKPDGGRYPLLIELQPGACRLHRLSHGIPADRLGKLQRFAQLLRSRLQGAVITNAAQIGQERIMLIEASYHQEVTRLYIRLWSNAANIIAADEQDTIIDAFYRRPGKQEVSGANFSVTLPASRSTPRASHSRLRDGYDQTKSFNEFIESLYATETKSVQLHERIVELEGLLQERSMRLGKLIRSKQKELESASSFDQLRRSADNLSASRHLIRPGSAWAEVPDYVGDGEMVTITLDENLSTSDNIESYYQAYAKAKRTTEHLIEDIESAQREIRALDAEKAKISDLEGEPDRQLQLIEHLCSRLRPQAQADRAGEVIPGLTFQSGLFTILVGRTAKENDKILRSHTRGNDYWLHVRDYPGSYVIIKFIAGKSVPLDTLLDAGNLALYYSKARSNGKADLYYTQVKHLRRAKGAKYGTVLPTHEKNITIELDRSRLDRLFSGEHHE